MVRYKIRKDAWTKRFYSINVTGKGVFKSAGGLLWNQLIGSWERQDGSWLSLGAKAEQSTIILCSSFPTNQVYEYDFTQVKDDGVDISYVVETKDFYQPNRFLRFDRFEFDLIGSGIEILCSLDRGESWTTFGTFNPGAIMKRVRHYQQKTGSSIRFKFQGTGSMFKLGSLGFRYKREALW